MPEKIMFQSIFLAADIINSDSNIIDLSDDCWCGVYLLAEKEIKTDAISADNEITSFAKRQLHHNNINYQNWANNNWHNSITGNYKAAIIFNKIGYLKNPSLFLKQVWQKLDDCGLIFISTPNRDFYPLRDNYFINHFDAGELRTLLSDNLNNSAI